MSDGAQHSSRSVGVLFIVAPPAITTFLPQRLHAFAQLLDALVVHCKSRVGVVVGASEHRVAIQVACPSFALQVWKRRVAVSRAGKPLKAAVVASQDDCSWGLLPGAVVASAPRLVVRRGDLRPERFAELFPEGRHALPEGPGRRRRETGGQTSHLHASTMRSVRNVCH